MTHDELQKLDNSMVQELQEIDKQLEELTPENSAAEGVRIPQYGDDQYDNALEDSDLGRNFALKQELESHKRKIQEAREKIKQGTYGVCASCTVNIPQKRLEAFPMATLCLSCAKTKLQA